jgi:thioredoxin-dependent peroxiredoxin
MRLEPGQWAPDLNVQDIRGSSLRLQQFAGRHLLVIFNKWTTCPFSTLRMHRLSHHYDQLRSEGLAILALYHTPAANVRKQIEQHPVPFPVIADPDMALYNAYGIERSFWRYFMLYFRVPQIVAAIRSGMVVNKPPDGDALLLPADFLIGPDLKIKIAHYGRDWGDHISLKAVRAHVAKHAELHGEFESAPQGH